MAISSMYIIAGCNGAGKTTASHTVLPVVLDCQEFINADEIAREIAPSHPEKVAIKSGKIMVRRMLDLLSLRRDFAIETTMASRSYLRTIQHAQEKGYTVTAIFFWLPTPEMAVERVKSRVRAGGHNVPQATILRRYEKGLHHFFDLYAKVCDYWLLIDNSGSSYTVIAEGKKHGETLVRDEDRWTMVEGQLLYGSESHGYRRT